MKIDIEKLICFLISDEVIENNIPESLKLGLKEQGYKYEDGKICPLQEEPVSEDLEEASKEWLKPQLDKSYADYGETKMMELTHFDGYAMLDAIEFGANWQKEHLMKDAVDGEIGYWNLRWLSVNADLPRTVAEGDKVKVILIKEK